MTKHAAWAIWRWPHDLKSSERAKAKPVSGLALEVGGDIRIWDRFSQSHLSQITSTMLGNTLRSGIASGNGSLNAMLSRSASLPLASITSKRSFSSAQDAIKACRLIEKDPSEFLEKYVAEDVLWTVTEPTGKSTPISGESVHLDRLYSSLMWYWAGIYKSRKAFADGALKPLAEKFDGKLDMRMGESLYLCW